MSKFAAVSAIELRTEPRNADRLARKVEYVVTVEVDDGSWCELDATDEAHAKTLAHNWVDKLGARGCSCWRVRLIDGRLTPNSFYHYYWTGEEPERRCREISSADVGHYLLEAFGRKWRVSEFIGRILPGDVGKRVYLVGDILQVENDEQRAARLEKRRA